MRYFYDTEFIDDGRTIELISIGMVSEDGREYYAVSTAFDPQQAGPWVRQHVLPKLPALSSPLWRSRGQIRDELAEFMGLSGAAGPPTPSNCGPGWAPMTMWRSVSCGGP